MLNVSKSLVSMATASLLILAGCGGGAESEEAAPTNTSTASGGESDHSHTGGEGHEHSHGEDDALVWEGEPEMLGDMEIKLGHHALTLHAGSAVEPAVSITLNGEAVADAKVFNSLLDADGVTVLAEEVPTIYEPETPDEPAHYAQGELDIPAGLSAVVIRFRIVPADGDEATFDIQVPVE